MPSVAAVAAAVAVACGAVNVRPYLTPLPGARVDSIPASADAIIRATAMLMTNEGIRIRRMSAEEGFLETDWHDVRTGEPARRGTVSPEHAVRFRFWADPVSPVASTLTTEVVVRRTVDPSLPVRETEVLAPAEHPGQVIIQRVLDALLSEFKD